MADPMTGPVTRCPWCSADLPIPGAERCLACGAALVSQTGGPDAEIKGVTTLDTEAILRARSEVARPRSRLLSFITGEAPPENPSAPHVPLRQAILWAAFSGIAVGLVRLLVERMAAAAWVRARGELPPGLAAEGTHTDSSDD